MCCFRTGQAVTCGWEWYRLWGPECGLWPAYKAVLPSCGHADSPLSVIPNPVPLARVNMIYCGMICHTSLVDVLSGYFKPRSLELGWWSWWCKGAQEEAQGNSSSPSRARFSPGCHMVCLGRLVGHKAPWHSPQQGEAWVLLRALTCCKRCFHSLHKLRGWTHAEPNASHSDPDRLPQTKPRPSHQDVDGQAEAPSDCVRESSAWLVHSSTGITLARGPPLPPAM